MSLEPVAYGTLSKETAWRILSKSGFDLCILGVGIICGALSPAARAETSVAKSIYPLTARLTFTSETRNACLVQESEARNPDCRIAVAERVEEAYASVLKHMFQSPPPGAPANLEIAVSVDISTFPESHLLALDTRVAISAPASGEVGRLQSYRTAPIFGSDQDSIANATGRAAEDATRDFKDGFANSVPVVNWLLAQGLEPVGSTVAWPMRGDWIIFGDLGGGLVAGSGDGGAGGLLLRIGIEGPWLIFQGIAGKWAPAFDTAPIAWPNDIRAGAQLNTTDLGLEAGPVIRFGRSLELRAGGGGHVLWGSASVNSAGRTPPVPDSSFSRVVPSLFGAFQFAFLPSRSGNRLRAGVELRRYVNTTTGFRELSRTIPIADTYWGVYLGFELPLSSRPSGIAGAAR